MAMLSQCKQSIARYVAWLAFSMESAVIKILIFLLMSNK